MIGLIGVPNLKEIDSREGGFGWLKVTFVKRCEEEKGIENGAILRNTYLANYYDNFFQILYVRLRTWRA